MATTLFALALAMLPPDEAPRSFYVRIAPSESLHVTERGAGRPVVLIPGLFGSAFGFRHVTQMLVQQGYRTLVIEPLGIGSSGRHPKSDYSAGAQAARVAGVMDSLHVRRAILVAHSAGAAIGYRLALRRPELVAAIVSLEGAAAETAVTPSFQKAMRFVPWVKWAGGLDGLRKKIRGGLIEASGDTSWVTDRVIQGYTVGAAADLDGTLKAFLRMAEAREKEKLAPRLGEIHAPVHLIIGGARHDGEPQPRQVAAMQSSLRAFTVDTIPGAGHYLHEERPGAVVAAIARLALPSRPVLGSGRPE